MVCDAISKKPNPYQNKSLNPYSIGIWSATFEVVRVGNAYYGLNPYSIGIWSATKNASIAYQDINQS